MNAKEGVKQAILIRKDLNMRKGKMISQGAHASMKVFFDKIDKEDAIAMMEDSISSDGVENACGNAVIQFLTPVMLDWMVNKFTKITLGVESEDELLRLYNRAVDLSIPASIIKDEGLTEFKEPTYTAVAIGPDSVSKIDSITGNLQLL